MMFYSSFCQQMDILLFVGFFLLQIGTSLSNNDVIYRINLNTSKDYEILQTLMSDPQLELIQSPDETRSFALFVGPDNHERLKKKVRRNLRSSSQNVDIVNIETITDGERKLLSTEKVPNPKAFNVNKYHPFHEISEYLEWLAVQNSDIARLKVIGHSEQGNPLYMINLSCALNETGQKKKSILLVSGMHAREWLTVSSTIYLLHNLVNGYKSGNGTMRGMLEGFDWLIVPILNPDGYNISWNGQRFWRKNYATTSISYCKGVDLNRNFDIHFGENLGHTSHQPCDRTYHGPTAFSEPETRALRDLAVEQKEKIAMFVDIHAAADSWLIPHAFDDELIEDYDDLHELAEIGARAAYNVHGILSKGIGPPGKLLGGYHASGISMDYMKSVVGIKYSYTLELRGNSFDPPDSLISDQGEEMIAAFSAMSRALVKQWNLITCSAINNAQLSIYAVLAIILISIL